MSLCSFNDIYIKVLGLTKLWLLDFLHENYYYTPLIISNYYSDIIHFILQDKWAKLGPNPWGKQKMKHHFAFQMSAVVELLRTYPLAFLSATGYYGFIIYLSIHGELWKLLAFIPPNLWKGIRFFSVGMRQMKLLSSNNRSYSMAMAGGGRWAKPHYSSACSQCVGAGWANTLVNEKVWTRAIKGGGCQNEHI